jgi:hypothetical protein
LTGRHRTGDEGCVDRGVRGLGALAGDQLGLGQQGRALLLLLQGGGELGGCGLRLGGFLSLIGRSGLYGGDPLSRRPRRARSVHCSGCRRSAEPGPVR